MKRVMTPLLLFAVTWAGAGSAAAQSTPATAPSTEELLNEVRALRNEVKDLRTQLNDQRQSIATTRPVDARAVAAEQAQTSRELERSVYSQEDLTAGYFPDKGFVIKSANGDFLMHPWAFVQIRDATNYRQRATATTDDTDTGFELPRMKFILDGNVFSRDVTYQFIWATSDTTGNLQLQDGWARYHIPNTPWAVQAGQIRDPVDHEQILFATKSLTTDRSIVNNVLLNGDDIVKGADISYGFDTASTFRAEVAVTNGERNFDTDFEAYPVNTADWGVAGRVEYKVSGDWADYSQFTSLGDKEQLLVFGVGGDYTEAGGTAAFTHVADVQFNTPDGLLLYGAYLGRYTRHDFGMPTTNGQFTSTSGASANTYDATVRVMAACLFEQRFEPFARYEYIHFDGREFKPGVFDSVQDLTLGFNYYFYGHRAKLTTGASYLPNGSPVSNTISDVLESQGHNELIFQAQVQLIF